MRPRRSSATASLAAILLVLATACHDREPCGAKQGRPAIATSVGLARGAETIRAMALLGLTWSPDATASDVLLLGYPNLRLVAIAGATEPIATDESGLHRTYAARGDGAGCDGDLRFRIEGRHGELVAPSLAGDLDLVLALARPTDVYTHAVFDGHPDHAEVFRQVDAALGRARFAGTLHTTLIHPDGTATCMGPSAEQWPNPALAGGDPFARFTPALDVIAPPIPPCFAESTGSDWGPDGAPDELVEVPEAMQRADPAENLKWQVIARYVSQVDCAQRERGYHASCGYMRAFVKRHEFFWTRRYGEAPVPAGGPVLVIAAHPDDEALGAAGVIAAARTAGRRVVVAVVTNGDAVP
jgi:LmbE family N-acetylglucosaminyl deacetylase